MAKRGRRGPRPSKNFRDAMKRLADEAGAQTQAADALGGESSQQNQVEVQAQAADALRGEPDLNQSQMIAQAANALVADQDMADASNSLMRQAASNEVEVFTSIEEDFYLEQLVASSKPVTRQATPVDEVWKMDWKVTVKCLGADRPAFTGILLFLMQAHLCNHSAITV
jgi:hypothetical protein